MTQTGGLIILYAWILFGAILASLAYLLLRHEKDPLEDVMTPTVDQPEPPPSPQAGAKLPARIDFKPPGHPGPRLPAAPRRLTRADPFRKP